VWQTNTVLHFDDDILIGMNNQTKMIEKDKAPVVTKEPALFYFHRQCWFNIVYIFHETSPYFYCNISSPFTYHHNVVCYIDYDIDLIVNDDLSYKIVDEDEYEVNKEKMAYGKQVETYVKEHVEVLKEWIYNKKGPFHEQFISTWRPHIE